MNIVVIDSGVRLSHVCFKNVNIKSYELTDTHFKQVYSDNDSFGHGTAICYLIEKSLQKQNISAQIIMIKAFENYETTEANVVRALDIVLKHFKADLINLSFGITSGKISSIINICNELSKKSIIISAADNAGWFTIPCILQNVIGVVSDDSLLTPSEYTYIESNMIQMGAYGKSQRVAWIGPDYCFVEGNSFACAHSTGIIAGLIDEYGKQDLQGHLRRQADHCIEIKESRNIYSLSIPFKIKRAAIFPLSKETSSLLLFEDMLGFEITEIYDSAITGKVGAKASQVLKLDLAKDHIIKNITEFTSNGIDTVIIGHLGEYIKHPKEYEKIASMLSKCNSDTYFYTFDSNENTSKLFSPIIGKDYRVPRINNGMMYYIHTPVIGVYGTNSKQGKFTLQLELRKEFIKRGYTVGQLGTEPQSLLFGFDSVYPMGYNSAVQLSEFDSILYLNKVIHEIEMKKDIDIIITGCQSGTIPYAFGHINNITLPQIKFLYGTCPDAVVLCVNTYDYVDYIKRTVKFIEGAVNSKVVALIIYPKTPKLIGKLEHDIKNVLDLDEYSSELSSKMSLPVFVLGKDTDKLCDIIIDYLSE